MPIAGVMASTISQIESKRYPLCQTVEVSLDADAPSVFVLENDLRHVPSSADAYCPI